MRYERTLAISKRHEYLLKLITTAIYSSPSLSEKLGVSEQTVYRDILFLRQQGYPIESVRLSKKWAYQLPKSKQMRQKRSLW
jgi:biotin operon repressor